MISQGLFRCAKCDGFASTAGRRLLPYHGVKAWCCAACAVGAPPAAYTVKSADPAKPWRTPRG